MKSDPLSGPIGAYVLQRLGRQPTHLQLSDLLTWLFLPAADVFPSRSRKSIKLSVKTDHCSCLVITQFALSYLFLGQILLPHDVHVWPDLHLGVRCFAPCAKEHEQKQKTLMSIHSRNSVHTTQQAQTQPANSDSFYKEINITCSCLKSLTYIHTCSFLQT